MVYVEDHGLTRFKLFSRSFDGHQAIAVLNF